MKTKRKKLGFALGSGGSRGVAHAGFLKAMEENGIKPDYISGCSMGAVVGAAYAAGLAADEIMAAIETLRIRDFMHLTRRAGGLFETDKVRNILLNHLGEIAFEELKTPFACVAVDMREQKIAEFKTGSVLDAVVASSAIPGVFKPTEKDGMRLVDGGVLERVPARLVKDMGADKVVVVDVLGRLECSKDCPNTLGMLLQVIDVMDNHRTARRREENRDIIDLWFEPALGDMNPYSLKQIRFAFDEGYKTGLNAAESIKALL